MTSSQEPIPPLTHPDTMPPVHTQADLQRFWRALMGPLGFGRARLFVVFVSPAGRVHPQVMDIEELPDLPDPQLVDNLMHVLASLLDAAHPAGTRVAVLYARPGSRGLSRADRGWASAVLAAGRRHGVPLWPVHLANDEELLVAAPDDLTDSA